ncbi:hypothetical protein AB0P28_14960 [Pseudarthrobacter sp. NPDC089323]
MTGSSADTSLPVPVRSLPEQTSLKLFQGFFDDAATFPPGLAPLETAVKDHVHRRANQFSGAVGPAVLKLEDLAQTQRIASTLHLEGRPITVSAVTPAGELQGALDAAERIRPQLELVSIELKTDPSDRDTWKRQIKEAASVTGIQVYIELTHEQIADSALDSLKGTDLRLKYRTGGLQQNLFPTPQQLAEVISQAVAAGIPFKLTAGLHEAVRYVNAATGFTHHGFLNIAIATDAARRGDDAERVAELLALSEPAAVAALGRASRGDWRESFISFGTCSVAEPAESLAALGLFPSGLA